MSKNTKKLQNFKNKEKINLNLNINDDMFYSISSINNKNLKLDLDISSIKQNKIINRNIVTPIKYLEKRIYNRLIRKYNKDANDYYKIKIEEIMNNDKSHVVAEFKDYLIREDSNEFIQQYYSKKQSSALLPHIYEYYESCSLIFPNYVILSESKYIYKNIQRKQRVIDIQQENEENEENKLKSDYLDITNETVITSKAFESILNQTNTSGLKVYFGVNEKDKVKDSQIMNLINNIDKAEVNAQNCLVLNNKPLLSPKETNTDRESKKKSNNQNHKKSTSMVDIFIEKYKKRNNITESKNNNNNLQNNKIKKNNALNLSDENIITNITRKVNSYRSISDKSLIAENLKGRYFKSIQNLNKNTVKKISRNKSNNLLEKTNKTNLKNYFTTSNNIELKSKVNSKIPSKKLLNKYRPNEHLLLNKYINNNSKKKNLNDIIHKENSKTKTNKIIHNKNSLSNNFLNNFTNNSFRKINTTRNKESNVDYYLTSNLLIENPSTYRRIESLLNKKKLNKIFMTKTNIKDNKMTEVNSERKFPDKKTNKGSSYLKTKTNDRSKSKDIKTEANKNTNKAKKFLHQSLKSSNNYNLNLFDKFINKIDSLQKAKSNFGLFNTNLNIEVNINNANSHSNEKNLYKDFNINLSNYTNTFYNTLRDNCYKNKDKIPIPKKKISNIQGIHINGFENINNKINKKITAPLSASNRNKKGTNFSTFPIKKSLNSNRSISKRKRLDNK